MNTWKTSKDWLAGMLRGSIGLLCLSIISHCESPNPVSAEYYLLSPLLIAGVQRPSAPSNLSAVYDVPSESIYLQWEASVDPDTGVIWNDYRIYFFLSSPPANIYQDRYRLATTSRTYYSIASDPFNGTVYFAVTAHERGSESLPSNFAQLSL